MTFSLKGYLLYAIVFVIALLILGDIYLIYQNNQVITFNKNQQEQAEKVKVNTSEVIRNLHLLDLSIRSYAFVSNKHFMAAMDSAIKNKNAALSSLESSLKKQNYPMQKFYALRDSVEAYVALALNMVDLIDRNDQNSFVQLLEKDPGYHVWLQYLKFSKDVYSFEDSISLQAKIRYEKALNNIYILQIILFFIAVPTLGYTAYYTNRSLLISDQLRKSEVEKAAILAEQNLHLERTVHERTREILAQNEEISSQNEEISMHNEQLVETKNIIERQNKLIQQKNEDLSVEVERQTRKLKQANTELMEHNNRLEQFAFIISHNLRAPMSRIIGLSSILDFTKEVNEVSEIAKLMMKSTQDLDNIIRDLTEILGIQKMNAQLMHEIKLEPLLEKVMLTLEQDVQETKANISADFKGANEVVGIPSYLESIFYNLISNAIKYRHPGRRPSISIKSQMKGDSVQIDIADNGLGINVEAHKENLFSLYKRFHFHVEGRGMGLYLVKTQVNALGGKIDLRSREGEGSVFTLWFKNINPAHPEATA
ncbi:HAMP domain-containing sensor histidine kinase [Chryseolinea sp. H1M3-3]|uniref:sensor histidine kinase n=1 Tax=Chryseolinea sp. H1M3-3 TaxID=3034144 RepID=UPI0023EB3267|nr:HAMP domain-containing sensor histidine kinase [Chryseolinea sp. H1M3-3]